MVADPGAAARADPLRPLNLPRPATVLTRRHAGVVDPTRPAALVEGGRRLPVARIEEVWCVEDEWWRRPISRRYYRLALADGRVRVVYHDRAAGAWFAQRY
jgi:hypothetical protein